MAYLLSPSPSSHCACCSCCSAASLARLSLAPESSSASRCEASGAMCAVASAIAEGAGSVASSRASSTACSDAVILRTALLKRARSCDTGRPSSFSKGRAQSAAEAQPGEQRHEVGHEPVVDEVARVGAQPLHVVRTHDEVELLRRERGRGLISRLVGLQLGCEEGEGEGALHLPQRHAEERGEAPAEVDAVERQPRVGVGGRRGEGGGAAAGAGGPCGGEVVQQHCRVLSRELIPRLAQVGGQEAVAVPEAEEGLGQPEGGAQPVEGLGRPLGEGEEQRWQRRARGERLVQQARAVVWRGGGRGGRGGGALAGRLQRRGVAAVVGLQLLYGAAAVAHVLRVGVDGDAHDARAREASEVRLLELL
eukprot:scaffold123132_cov54-Phaeocystis_antarctica.AAC.1